MLNATLLSMLTAEPASVKDLLKRWPPGEPKPHVVALVDSLRDLAAGGRCIKVRPGWYRSRL